MLMVLKSKIGWYEQRTLVQLGVATNFDKILQAPFAVNIHQVEIPQAAEATVQTQLSRNNP